VKVAAAAPAGTRIVGGTARFAELEDSAIDAPAEPAAALTATEHVDVPEGDNTIGAQLRDVTVIFSNGALTALPDADSEIGDALREAPKAFPMPT
jgi:hypothetical protein